MNSVFVPQELIKAENGSEINRGISQESTNYTNDPLSLLNMASLEYQSDKKSFLNFLCHISF